MGEGPGFNEDKQGEPFVGAAGKLLNELLGGIGLTRADVYIANVVKCRPPDNRDPLPDEIEACSPHLLEQIAIIRPEVICTLGRFATKLLAETELSMTAIHGKAKPLKHRRGGPGASSRCSIRRPRSTLRPTGRCWRRISPSCGICWRTALGPTDEALARGEARAVPTPAEPPEPAPRRALRRAPAATPAAPHADLRPAAAPGRRAPEQLPLW